MFYPKENNISIPRRWGSIDLADLETLRLLYAFKAIRSLHARQCWDKMLEEHRLLYLRLTMYMMWWEQLTSQKQEGDLLSYKEKLRMNRIVEMQFTLMEVINAIQGGYN